VHFNHVRLEKNLEEKKEEARGNSIHLIYLALEDWGGNAGWNDESWGIKGLLLAKPRGKLERDGTRQNWTKAKKKNKVNWGLQGTQNPGHGVGAVWLQKRIVYGSLRGFARIANWTVKKEVFAGLRQGAHSRG